MRIENIIDYENICFEVSQLPIKIWNILSINRFTQHANLEHILKINKKKTERILQINILWHILTLLDIYRITKRI